MVLKNTESTIAYRCPHCGSGILSMVGVFALSGDMIKLKCDCGKSELVMQKTSDGKIRLTVPCMMCPKPHRYVVSPQTFFGEDLFTVPCSMTGSDVCFIGKQDAVMQALDASEKELLAMLKDAGYGEMDSLAEFADTYPAEGDTPDAENGDVDSSDDYDEDDDVNFTDNHIYDMVLFVVRDLEEEGKIRCRCTEAGEKGDYDVVCDRDRIYVTCKTCGARREILCNGSMSTQAFLEADRLVLEGRAVKSGNEPENEE